MCSVSCILFFFSSRRRHTRCALVTGVQTCALPICNQRGHRISPCDLVQMPANARHAGAEALEHIAVTLRFKRRTCWFELVGQELDMRIIFLQPRVVELTDDRRDARVPPFAIPHAVAGHQYLGLPARDIPTTPAKPFLSFT